MTENYDISWDLIESNKGNLPVDEDAGFQNVINNDVIPSIMMI
jgi:hypothetical protein